MLPIMQIKSARKDGAVPVRFGEVTAYIHAKYVEYNFLGESTAAKAAAEAFASKHNGTYSAHSNSDHAAQVTHWVKIDGPVIYD